MSTPLTTDDPAAHLALQIRALAQLGAPILTPSERAHLEAFFTLTPEMRQFCARLAQRRRPLVRRDDCDDCCPPAAITTAIALGWLTPISCVAEPALVCRLLSRAELGQGGTRDEQVARILARPDLAAAIDARHGPFIGLPPALRERLAGLRLLVFGDWHSGVTDWIRLALGHWHLPAGCPLDRLLHGQANELAPPPAPLADWRGLLCARALGDDDAEQLDLASLLRLAAAERGRPLPLGHSQFCPGHLLGRALWHRHQAEHSDPALRARLRSVLWDLPLAPHLAARVWEAHWRAAQAGERKRRAAICQDWRIWTDGERSRWRLRASGGRRRRADRLWPERQFAAWLDHDPAGRVLAEGDGVESYALRRLAQEGWAGLHCEGALWWSLTLACAWPLISAACPGQWWAPAQVLPADWLSPAFALRRQAALGALHRQLLADPRACLARGWRALGLEAVSPDEPLHLLALGPLHARRALEGLCERLPARLIATIVDRLLRAPRERSGLPDLVVWRDQELMLWEVKSPGDTLSDQQVAWLEWLCLHDFPAGLMRITARPRQQTRLLEAEPPPRLSQAPPARRRQASRLRQDLVALILADGQLLRPPADWQGQRLHNEVLGSRQRQADADANPWQLQAMAAEAVVWERRRGRQRETQIVLIPAGWLIVLATRAEAAATGGLATVCRLVVRRPGWLAAGPDQLWEPALVAASTTLDTAQLDHPPPSAPPRADLQAAAWGISAQLDQQRALLAHEPHACTADPQTRRIHIALAPDAAVLWLDLPDLQRTPCPWLRAFGG